MSSFGIVFILREATLGQVYMPKKPSKNTQFINPFISSREKFKI